MRLLDTQFPAKSAQEQTSNADGLLLIVTTRQIDKQLQEISDQLISMATHFAHKKVVVLINKLCVSSNLSNLVSHMCLATKSTGLKLRTQIQSEPPMPYFRVLGRPRNGMIHVSDSK